MEKGISVRLQPLRYLGAEAGSTTGAVCRPWRPAPSSDHHYHPL